MKITDYLCTAAVILFLDLKLVLVTIAASLAAILVSFLFSRKVVQTETAAAEKASDFVAQTKDLLSGFTVIKSFRAEQETMEVFSRKNEILVLHNGRIEESGTFDDLIAQKGYFYSLYRISQ